MSDGDVDAVTKDLRDHVRDNKRRLGRDQTGATTPASGVAALAVRAVQRITLRLRVLGARGATTWLRLRAF